MSALASVPSLLQESRSAFLRREFEEALRLLQEAQHQHPEHPEVIYQLGSAYFALQRFEAAQGCFEKAAQLAPQNGLWQWRSHTTCPALWQTAAEIQQYREKLLQYLKGLDCLPFEIPLNDLPFAMAEPSFYLMYQGEDDKAIKAEFARLFHQAFLASHPQWMRTKALHPGSAQPRTLAPHQRRKIGFMVTEKHEGVFCKLNAGFINHLNRDRYEVTVLCDSSQSAAAIGSQIEALETEYVILPAQMEAKIPRIRAQKLEVLFHFEIGSDATNYFLPYFDLAPIQCTSMGLPITSGIPAVNWFLTSTLLEREDGQADYTETLYSLETMPVYFYRPQLTDPPKDRQAFNLPLDKHLYLCPQTLYKLHPDFDPLLSGILAQDPAALILFLDGPSHIKDQLFQRFETHLGKTIPDFGDRIRFLPRVDSSDFLQLLSLADVMLDPTHVNGGITSQEALFFGTPIVTLPHRHFRGRMTQACYQAMGVSEAIATDDEDYIQKAVALATQPDRRAAFKSKILAHNGVLFENPDAITGLEAFIETALRETPQKGGTP